MDKLINLIKNLFVRKKVEPTKLAYYLLWYNRDDNWFERLYANKQLELLFWNPEIYGNAPSVQSAGSTPPNQ